VEYIDPQGILHENFFLLPIAFLFLFGGFITFFVTGVRNVASFFHDKNQDKKKDRILWAAVSLGVIVLCMIAFFVLRSVNSGV
jgi:predicted permease